MIATSQNAKARIAPGLFLFGALPSHSPQGELVPTGGPRAEKIAETCCKTPLPSTGLEAVKERAEPISGIGEDFRRPHARPVGRPEAQALPGFLQ